MDRVAAETFLAEHTRGVLVTIRRDGRPQTSNIVYGFADGVARISVTATRAKTANLRRDPRAVLHVSSEDFWSYVSASGSVDLSAETTERGDAVGEELLDLYNRLAPEPHPDPDDFYRAMVEDHRLVVRFLPQSFTGSGVPR